MFQTWNRQGDVVMKDIIRCGSVVFRKESFIHAQIKSLDRGDIWCIFGRINNIGDNVVMFSSPSKTEVWQVFDKLATDLGIE